MISACQKSTNKIAYLAQAKDVMCQVEQTYRATFERAAVGLAHVASDGHWLRINPKFCDILGYTCEELLGLASQDITHPEDGDVEMAYALHLLAGEIQTYSLEKRYIRKDGSQVWVNQTVSLVREPNGEPKYFIFLAKDITDRKLAESALQESEAEMRALLAAMTDVVLVLDRSGRYLKIAPTNPDLLYKPAPELIGKTLHETLPRSQADLFLGYIHHALETQQTLAVQYSVPIQEREIWFDVSISPLRSNLVIWVARDINSRKQAEESLRKANEQLEFRVEERTVQLKNAITSLSNAYAQLQREISDRIMAEEALKQSEQKYRHLVETSQDTIWSVDASGHYTFVNQAVRYMYGYEPQEMIGRHFSDFQTPEQVQKDKQVVALISQGHSYLQYETTHLRKDGTPIQLSFNAIVLRDESGNILGTTGTGRDITHSKKAMLDLKDSQERFKLAVSATNDGVWDWDLRTGGVFLSSVWMEILGYSEGEIPHLLTTWSDRVHPDDLPITIQQIQNHLDGNTLVYNNIHRMKHKDGRWLWVEAKGKCVRDGSGKPYRFTGTIADISDRKHSEEALRQSEAAQAGLIASLQQQTTRLEQTLRELQQTQSQLVQTEKMSSLGQLVAGVAHEINNPVSFIYGNLPHIWEYVEDILGLISLYQQEYPNPTPAIVDEMEAIDLDFLRTDLPKMLSSMKMGASRICEIVRSLRNFSRLDEAAMKDVDIHEGIDSTLMILQNRMKAQADHPGIQVIKEYGKLPPVECFAGQLNQVFMNLIGNAIDALDDAIGKPTFSPTITIRTYVVEGNQVAIAIADNGKGMPESIRSRLFDPFFTTKPAGKGTGLGLSISQSIVVEKHGGALRCNSAPGQGTEFIIQVPINQPNQEPPHILS
ncbi:PAS domain S-box protein [Microcoleus sp. FACHB-831]|uniref:PAS domain-containing sensor histidine kinase n=1 Tax=Microcoleus sp. FACHB-831 TaxID=2692827 RepID=UPI001683591D|nr:PAS domain S-box protein [Microcoleus sp. FACHB-831]MBD1919612.1 PAS domain S-box protein [Microcoleus sp. FACHB-831]